MMMSSLFSDRRAGRLPWAARSWRRSLRGAILLGLSGLGLLSRGQAAVSFSRDIQPILSDNCFHCHGPDEANREAKLRLDRPETALAGGRSGLAAVVPGKSEESELILRITSTYEDEMMPPPESHRKLSAQQIDLLKRWIDEGAKWEKHWAYEAPVRPALPVLAGGGHEGNPVDRFVRARLEREGIAPSAEADRRTLIRRLSLDLLGLPPERAEIQAFLEDRRPDAYERLVERLLASPHFGERWGRHWLDLARYADSAGYLNDTLRPYAYLYRDWVIKAINADQPFDQFTIEQLAGDLLPGATLEQKIATGFHRNSLRNDEAGADLEEDRTKAAVDRVATTGAVWLGLTVGCAECHTHKYDQITHREFFQLYAFFNNTADVAVAAPQPAELLKYLQEQRAWETKRTELEDPLSAYLRALPETTVRGWEGEVTLPATRWTVLAPQAITLVTEEERVRLEAGEDQTISPRPQDVVGARWEIEAEVSLKAVTGFRVEALTDPGKRVGRTRRGDFDLSEFAVFVQVPGGERRRLELASARADFEASNGKAANAIDGDPKTGWRVSPRLTQSHVIVFELKAAEDFPAGSRLVFELEHNNVAMMNRLRLAVSTSATPLVPSLIPDATLAAFDTPAGQRSAEQQQELARYLAEQQDPEAKVHFERLLAHSAKKPDYPPTHAAILGINERPTHIHLRGDFRSLGEAVQPGTLEVLHAFKPRGETPDRLDLARWLVAPENPLTARVTVNRIWKHLFGRGLVATVENFGTRGDPPTHPELLDFLATEFMREGWSLKRMIQLIVTSATYRQSSVGREDLIDRDPLNTLLARQNRNRLEAEVVRDVFLATSGLLNPAIGGPSIYPPLPAFVTGFGRDTSWPATKGEDQYRRGLYVHLRRNIPYPMLLTFDAPDASAACFTRDRSNTPLQALTLLNDQVFFECSQALGQTLAEQSGAIEQRLQDVFEHCMSRPPSGAELQATRSLYQDQLQLTGQDETKSLVAVARVLMNLDEFITRN